MIWGRSRFLCLYGPRVSVKTSLGKNQLQEALGREYVRISLGGFGRDEAWKIRGS